MHLTTLSCLLAALSSAYTVLAQSLPQQTPSPSPDLVEAPAHLEPRQGGPGVVLTATLAGAQVPAVTVYAIATQIGATAVQTEYTYTQLFSPVPDQWPSPKAGVIGYGKRRRDLEPRQTVVGTVTQTVVMVMETEVVTQPLQRVTEVLVVQTMAVSGNRTVLLNDTAIAGNHTRPAGLRGTGLRATGLRVAPTATG